MQIDLSSVLVWNTAMPTVLDLAQQYGAGQLVRFYDAVSAGAPTEQTFRRVLGTTQGRFVARWSADVAALARVAR